MNSFQRWIIAVIFALGFVFYYAIAHCQQPFQVMGCSSGKIVVLSENESLTIYSRVGEGEAWATSGIAHFTDMKWVLTATLRSGHGKNIGIGHCKFIDSDGDYFILEANGEVISNGGDWEFLHGTGKWSGLHGTLGGRVVFRGRPLNLETEKYWCRIIGTLDLPH